MITIKRWLQPTWAYLTAVTLLGTLARFINIAQSSIWHDEGFTMMLVAMPDNQIVARTARDVHPPLYYLVLHYWIKVFGRSETGARSLSALFLIAAIPLTYALILRLWDRSAARLATLCVALGPFLIRYSQEARMYAMVAFLLLLATYALIRALDTAAKRWWALYAFSMAAALYTHYYAIFMVIVHSLYTLSRSNRQAKTGWWDWRWWTANGAVALLFMPWLPIAYNQFSRVQTAFWIPNLSIATLPDTLSQFIIFGPDYFLTPVVLLGAALIVALLVKAYISLPKRRQTLWFLYAYIFVGPVVVFLLSFKRPIYVDRYFVYASIAFYALVGCLISTLKPKLRQWVLGGVVVVFCIGIVITHVTNNHKMRVIGAYVNTHYRPGDDILSGELYTFFDFSYYNHTGHQMQLWSTDGVDGYSESSLIYDRAAQIVVRQLSTIHPRDGHLWMVGKTGYQPYYDPKVLPADWKPIGPKIQSGYVAVQEYDIPPRSDSTVGVQ